MGKKNKKGGKATLDLNSFLAAGPTAPAAPSGSSSGYGDSYGGYGGYGRDREGYGERPKFDKSSLPSGPRASMGPEDIDLSQLPSSPPYTVFLGNLAYETQEIDIEQFFESNSIKCSSVRIPRSIENDRIKGFGYAEFQTVDDLKAALMLSNETILQRRVRIDLAGQSQQGGDREGSRYEESRADNDSMWRRPAGDKGFGSGPGEGDDGFGGRDRGGFGGRDHGGFGDRDRGGYDRPPPRMSRADEDAQWSRGEAPPPRQERPGYGDRGGFDRDGPPRGGFGRDGPDRYGGDRYGGRNYGSSDGGSWERGVAPPPREDREPPRAGGFDRDGPPRGGFDRDGPRGNSYNRGPPRDEPETWARGEALPAAPEAAAPVAAAPASRPKLNLARRSAPAETVGQQAGGSDIFGAAKPVDTAAKLAEVESKLGEARKYAAPKKAREDAEEPAAKPPKKPSASDGTWERGALQEAPPAKAAPAPVPAPVVKDEPAPKAPVNAFAGLAVEDDGDEN